ncbi:FHA domain-containing protein, partial [bacterium]|nr:FHA domain-containing protein [bacterium]
MAELHLTDRDTSAQRVIALSRPRLVVGKHPGSDLFLDKISISRQHCEIINANGGFFVRDLGSKNGTWVDGKRITGDTALHHGSHIDLGPIHLILHDPDAAPASPPATQGTQPPAKRAQAAAARPEAAAQRRLIPSALKKKIHERLLIDLDLRHSDIGEHTDEELRAKAEAVVRNAVATMAADVPTWVRHEQLVKEVVDEAVGLGPLEDLL